MAELNEDEVDDLLYFARSNEIHDLKTHVAELSQKYGVPQSTIFQSAIDPSSGNAILHLASANGHLGMPNNRFYIHMLTHRQKSSKSSSIQQAKLNLQTPTPQSWSTGKTGLATRRSTGPR